MIDILTILALVTTASIIVGVVFTLLEIQHFNKTRKTEIIMKIYEARRMQIPLGNQTLYIKPEIKLGMGV